MQSRSDLTNISAWSLSFSGAASTERNHPNTPTKNSERNSRELSLSEYSHCRYCRDPHDKR